MRYCILVTLFVCAAGAQNSAPAPKPGVPPPPDQRSSSGPRLGSSAQRNENVIVYQIDNNAIKEAGIRLGSAVTIVPEATVETTWYGTEYGRPAGEIAVVRPLPRPPAWHGELYEWHQNSVFNARTFFQVGDVLPSRRNAYGGRITGAFRAWSVTASASQRKVRGMVNGNVLVPLASERTPQAADPRVRAVVSRFLAAYPASLPNRPDFDPRALNTNSPQRIDDTDGTLRLEREFTPRDKLVLSHALTRQRIRAFQLVAGQNPDTEIHSHRSRASWRHSLDGGGEFVGGFSFNRVRSLLVSEPNAVGPRVRLGYQIEELGPDSQFPIDRAQNSFRGGALALRPLAGGRHTLTFGGDFTRFQLNGVEATSHRGFLQFTNNFGRTAIQNLLLGTPSSYEITIGDLSRGYRNWSANAFFADRWKARANLEVYWGVRYTLDTAPVEIRSREILPYPCDCNNFSPRFAVAFRPGSWVLRASYSVSFSQILPVTYQQARNRLPLVRYIQVQNPDLLDPLKSVPKDGPARTSPTFLAPDLVAPYVHQYNYTLERRLAGGLLARMGYVGSRNIKTLNAYIMNRAEPVPGVPKTLATVDQRRPDPRYYDVKNIVNGGIGYLDAAQFRLEIPSRRGFTGELSYTFGKAIDEGAEYSFTAANLDLTKARSQYQYESRKDKKGLSTFDSTHALLVSYTYDLPRLAPSSHWFGAVGNGWQVSGATMLKSGTPLTLYIGSDSPGFGNVDGGPSDRPNILDPSILGMTISHPDTSGGIIRRGRFAFLGPDQMSGSLGRNTFRKSGIANWNAALSKLWRFGGGREWTAVLRAEAYNLTNHPQFDEPQRNLSSPSFGRITNTLNDGRVFQIGLRLLL